VIRIHDNLYFPPIHKRPPALHNNAYFYFTFSLKRFILKLFIDVFIN